MVHIVSTMCFTSPAMTIPSGYFGLAKANTIAVLQVVCTRDSLRNFGRCPCRALMRLKIKKTSGTVDLPNPSGWASKPINSFRRSVYWKLTCYFLLDISITVCIHFLSFSSIARRLWDLSNYDSVSATHRILGNFRTLHDLTNCGCTVCFSEHFHIISGGRRAYRLSVRMPLQPEPYDTSETAVCSGTIRSNYLRDNEYRTKNII